MPSANDSSSARDESGSGAEPLISVVVPTRDRPGALTRCLDALAAQTVRAQIEIVVVDDGSSRPAVAAELVARYGAARLLRLPGRGPAAARNAGAFAARGTFLCFTDDDCEPRPEWAERLAETLRAGADAVAGVTVPGRSGDPLLEASELVAHAPAAAHPPPGSDLSFAPSNNLACRSSVFADVRFDERYPTAAGEDRDWCARLTGGGYAFRYEPAAVVVHHQQLTLKSFWRQQLRYGRGAFRFRRGAERRPLEAPSFYAILLRRAFARGFWVGVLVCAAQLATAIGFAREWVWSRCVGAAELSPEAD